MAVTRRLPRHGPYLTGLFGLGLLLVFVGQRVLGEPGLARTVLDSLGVALVVGVIVMRLVGRSRVPKEAGQVETLVASAYAFGLLGLGLYFLSLPSGLEFLGLAAETAPQVSVILGVLWPVAVLCALLAAVFVEAAYASMPVLQAVEMKRVFLSAGSGLTIGLVLCYLFAFNYVANVYEARRDLSYFRVTEPSESTFAMVERLNEPMEVVLFYPQANEVLEQIRPYFEEVAAKSPSLTVRITDHVLSPSLAKTHRVRGNGHVLITRNKAGSKFEVGTEFEEARAKMRRLDLLFQEHFNRVGEGGRTLYKTKGHGERDVRGGDVPAGERLNGFAAIVKQLGLDERPLGVSEGLGTEVPEDAAAVAIIGPQQSFLPEETATLVRYVKNGGRLFLLLEPDNNAGLGDLLAAVGASLEPGTLCHERALFRRSFTKADRTLLASHRFSSHPSVTTAARRMEDALFFGAGRLDEVGGDAVRTNVTLRAVAGTWADQNGDFEFDSTEERGSPTVALASTIEPSEPDGRSGRAVVVADADVISDQILLSVASQDGAMMLVLREGANYYFARDTLRWLTGQEGVTGEVSSEEDVDIQHTRDQDVLWFYGTCFVVPVVVGLLGIVVHRRRKSRRGRSS